MSSKARELALEVYHRSNQGGGFANILLPKVLSKSGLDIRDRSFTTELVYGALRKRGAVDFALSRFSSRPLVKIDPLALDALRLGAYQILFMNVPDRAAINEAVEVIKRKRHSGAASFANAVLRKLSVEKAGIPWPIFEDDPVGYLTVVESHPEWLVEMWIREFGLEDTARICRADNLPKSTTLRTNVLKADADSLSSALREKGWTVEPGSYVPEALVVRNGGDLSSTEEFASGNFYIQDESSMLAVLALGAEPGNTIVDLCSGPGGKTTYLAERMVNSGRIISVELNPKRLNLVKEACAREGIAITEFVEADAAMVGEFVREQVDGILLDAPCSGLGVLASRPDSRWRKSPEIIDELAVLQSRLLDAAAPLVKPGGILVYSVCTISRREGPDQVERFLEKHPEFVRSDLESRLPEALRPDVVDGTIQLIPGKHKTNGMFIARMKKSE